MDCGYIVRWCFYSGRWSKYLSTGAIIFYADINDLCDSSTRNELMNASASTADQLEVDEMEPGIIFRILK